ncbi:unnamed protein product [Cylindrotheca closterium]|uniref:SET domain-containing protein n=1 Tax=Cylindrotheca closterium TaxID=2856 RepID=A0AAD2FSL1_9STRA|nr:unnamed protein product [Cylindrotheca closterium]
MLDTLLKNSKRYTLVLFSALFIHPAWSSFFLANHQRIHHDHRRDLRAQSRNNRRPLEWSSSTLLSLSKHKSQHRRPPLSLESPSRASAKLHKIRIAEAGKKGLGAFCLQRIESGELVGEYKGEILTRNQVEARYWGTRSKQTSDRRWIKSRKKRDQGLSGDYLFELGENKFLDGEDADISGWCRFMNHATENSKACNVETSYSVRKCTAEAAAAAEEARIHGVVYSSDLEAAEPRVWFVAMRDIEAGEELSYDYGDSYWDDLN